MRGDPKAKGLRLRLSPVELFVAFALLLNFSIPFLFDWIEFLSFEKEIQMLFFFVGVVAGECCFVALLSGFAKRTWLGAYLFGLGLAVAGYGMVLCGSWLVDTFDQELVAGVAVLPTFLLAATSPLYLFRHFFGWRLVNRGETPSPRQPLRLADIFSIIAIVAAVLVMVRVPQVISESESRNYWPQIVITCLVFFGASLVLLPLHARVVLRDSPISKRAAWLGVFSVMIVVICFGITQFFYDLDVSWHNRLEVLPFLLTFLASAITVFYLGLSALAASGVQLVRGCELKSLRESEEDVSQLAHLRQLTWWRIGGAIAVTMATSIYLANLQQWRAARDKGNAMLGPRAQATGGELGVVDRIPTNLSLGEKATDDDLAAFSICSDLEYLYLRKSKITDAGLEHLSHFPQLRSLSLDDLPITDVGLFPLSQLPHLETLQIENCGIRVSNLLSLPNKQHLTSLDLSHTQFADDECELLVEFPHLQSLTLNHTRITDRGLAAIGRVKTLTTLHLVGTEVGTDAFPFLPVLRTLDLSETNVNDAALSSIAKLTTLQSLTLRETKITHPPLSELSRLKKLYRIDLSDNPIDDEGIRQLVRSTSLVAIDLSCTKVNGSGFANWQFASRSQEIILDRTLIDDDGVKSLNAIGETDTLSLTHTNVTDACLPHLAQIVINDLYIGGTQITFAGLINSGLPSVSMLHVATGQFTPPQIAQLKKQLGIRVKVEST